MKRSELDPSNTLTTGRVKMVANDATANGGSMTDRATIKNGGVPSTKKKAAEEKYAIGRAILEPAIHHESFAKLWETKWKAPVSCRVSLAVPGLRLNILTATFISVQWAFTRLCSVRSRTLNQLRRGSSR
jgi:hypothetical protein